jgi:hypothetical protein
MARIEKTIFISYRRTDVYTALAVYENLKNQGYDVFFDYRSISSGDFEQIIISNIRARAHFILILTPTALDRCKEPSDWLRREIEFAIDEKRNIVPLFFKGFQFGDPAVTEKLTGKLKNLSRYNGLNVHEDFFDEAMQRLQIQYLNVPLDTVLHPVPSDVQKMVKEEKIAADKALENIVDVKELANLAGNKSGEKIEYPPPFTPQTVKKKTTNRMPWLAILGLGGMVIVLCIVGGVILYFNYPPFHPLPTETDQPIVREQPTNPISSAPPSQPAVTEAPENPTPIPPTENSNPFISSKVTLQNVPFREIDPGSGYPPYEITAKIPQLTGSEDWQVQDFNQSVSNFVTDEIDNYRQEFKSAITDIGGTSTLDVTYLLVSQVGDVWSFRFNFPYYVSGAAHPSEKSIVFNYDLSQAKELTLSDLFIPNSNFLDLLSNYCSNQLSTTLGDAFFPDGAKPALENYTHWNVRSDGILITFDVYQVGPGVAGPQEVLVPYDELKSVIAPEGPLLFLYR